MLDMVLWKCSYRPWDHFRFPAIIVIWLVFYLSDFTFPRNILCARLLYICKVLGSKPPSLQASKPPSLQTWRIGACNCIHKQQTVAAAAGCHRLPNLLPLESIKSTWIHLNPFKYNQICKKTWNLQQMRAFPKWESQKNNSLSQLGHDGSV